MNRPARWILTFLMVSAAPFLVAQPSDAAPGWFGGLFGKNYTVAEAQDFLEKGNASGAGTAGESLANQQKLTEALTLIDGLRSMALSETDPSKAQLWRGASSKVVAALLKNRSSATSQRLLELAAKFSADKDYGNALTILTKLTQQPEFQAQANDQFGNNSLGFTDFAKKLVDEKKYVEGIQIANQVMAFVVLPDAQKNTQDEYKQMLNDSRNNLALALAIFSQFRSVALYDPLRPQASVEVFDQLLIFAQNLYEKKDFDNALLVLSKVLQNPDYLAKAQDQIRRIRIKRDEYNAVYNKFITAFRDKDEEAQATLLTQLKAIENRFEDLALQKAERAVLQTKFDKRANVVMDAASGLLKAGDYAAAVIKYLEIEQIPDLRPDFISHTDTYDELNVINPLNAAWTEFRDAAGLFASQEAALSASRLAASAALQGDPAALESAVAGLAPSWENFFSWRRRVVQSSIRIQAAYKYLQERANQTDFLLTYTLWMNQGRPSATTAEGLVAALDQYWSATLGAWIVPMRSRSEAQYQTAKRLFDEAKYDEAGKAFQTLRTLLRSYLDVLALANNQAGIMADGSLDKAYLEGLKTLLPLASQLESRLVVASDGIQATSDLGALAAATADTTLNRDQLNGARERVRTQRENFIAAASRITALQTRESSLVAAGWTLNDPPSLLTGWFDSWNRFRLQIGQQEAVFVDRRGKLDYDVLDTRNRALAQSLVLAREQTEGTPKYSREAVSALSSLRPQQVQLQADVTAFVTLYDDESPDVKTSAVLAWPPKGRAILATLTQAQRDLSTLATTAALNAAEGEKQAALFESTRPQIEDAITAKNFTRSSTLLTQLLGAYKASLDRQEDVVFRRNGLAESNRLQDLNNRQFKAFTFEQVDNKIVQGKDFFSSAEFSKAQNVLEQAKAQLAQVDTAANPELEYWLGLSQSAQGASSGREVNPEDPLYNEVQQMLNFARKDYYSAQELLNSGAVKTQYDPLFDQALTTVNKILTIYQFNQEMGLLKLQIIKDRNPAGFPAEFRRQRDEAIDLAKTDKTKAQNDLRNLDQIQPGDPVLRKALQDIADSLSPKQKTLDAATKARAERLYVGAKASYDSGNQVRMIQARTDINAAISLLLPFGVTDRRFTQLRRSIGERLDSLAIFTAEMSAANEEILAALNDGSYAVANRLWNDFVRNYPAARDDPRLKKELERIQNGLGQ